MRVRGLGWLRRSAGRGHGILLRAKQSVLRRRDAVNDAMIAPGVGIRRDGMIFIDENWSPAGVTQQFIGDAATYHQRYFDRLDFVSLIDRCLMLAGVPREREMRVLDIGSGGGSSVLAACRLLPRAEIFASDISPPLLAMLAVFVESKDELRGRIRSYCFDVHRRFFRPDVFDLVLGAAILHHLLDPRAALVNVCASLKPGGKIVLIEPLEAGSLVLCTMYGAVLRVLAELGQGDGALARLMKALRLDIQCRLGPPAAKPWTPVVTRSNTRTTASARGRRPCRGAGARCRAVASFALDLGMSAPALETHNSPCGLRQCVSPLRGRSGPDAAVPSRSAMRPPVTAPPPPRSITGTAEGRRGGEVSSGGTK